MSRFYITTPIYYVNAEPHLGHASTTIFADAIARSRRLMGQDVFFLTGTDEHGQKIERAAQAAGMAPRAFADRIAERFRDLTGQLNISNDDFIRTTEARHYRAVEAIWRRVRDAGDLYKGTYEGWYCSTEQIFVPEAQLVGGNRCPDCGSIVERLTEESYFFRLSKYQEPLLEHYRAHPEFVTPDNRRNEMMAFIGAGLRDLSVSRTSFSWGIPVPDDPSHVIYVWFDALTNYLTAVGFGDDAAASRERVDAFWPADVHLMGKEIVRQHSIYWPAFLMSAGLPLPRRIIGHGWWLMEGAKMSKSLGNVVRPKDYTDRFGVDALRYFVLREMTLAGDASFDDEGMLARYNADLANDLGNLASRVTTMIHRYCGAVVPAATSGDVLDGDLRAATRAAIERVTKAVAEYDFAQALTGIWELVSRSNKYLVAREPWALAKSPDKRALLDQTLYQAADSLRVIAALIDPVMPESAARLRTMLGTPQESWLTLAPGALAAGGALGAVEPLFPRMELTVDQLRAMAADQNTTPSSTPAASTPAASSDAGTQPGAATPASAPAPAAPAAPAAASSAPAAVATSATPPAAAAPAADADGHRITYEDFMKTELRVAKVLAAERVPKSKKLLKLTVDAGGDPRTVVAGIAEAYEPEALVGRSIVIVANLQPAKLMGIESNGMVLAGSPEGGQPQLLTFDVPPPPGSRVR